MKTTKLERANGFLVVDLEGAPAVGVTRLAPKVLVDGAELLARSLTYAFAAFGLKISGGSAGINATDADHDDAVTGYLEDVASLVGAGQWHTWPGTGVTADDLAPLNLRAGSHDLNDPGLIAAGAVAAAKAVAPDASTVAISAAGPVAAAARDAATAAGLTPVDGGPDAAADVLLLGGKAGVLDHHGAEGVAARVVVPVSPVPVTAKAYAVLSRAGTVYVPDFLATAAPLLAGLDADGGDAVTRVADAVAKVAPQGVDAWRAAVADAEAFLASWRDGLPFGRPLA